MNERDQIRAAMVRLTGVLSDIARTADEKDGERCPYKTVELRCTYRGGCQNQRREPKVISCAGDHLIVWDPVSSDPTPENSDLP